MYCQVINRFFSAMAALAEAEKAPRDYGTGHLLYRSEMSFIEAISSRPDPSAIELSELLGVTRGAVTQMGGKLEEKGFIEKYSRPDNKKEKHYRLTDSGRELVGAHRQYHEMANSRMCEYLCSLGDEKKEVIAEFLDKLTETAPISDFECYNRD